MTQLSLKTSVFLSNLTTVIISYAKYGVRSFDWLVHEQFAVLIGPFLRHVTLESPFSRLLKLVLNNSSFTFSTGPGSSEINRYQTRTELSEGSKEWFCWGSCLLNYEHFQANRRSVPPSSHHHFVAKNMEIEVLCR